MLYEWETFLSLERQHSQSLVKRNFFILDAAFILNLMPTAIGCCCYYVAIRQPGFHLSRLALAGFATGLVIITVAYVGHFTSNAAWKLLVSTENWSTSGSSTTLPRRRNLAYQQLPQRAGHQPAQHHPPLPVLGVWSSRRVRQRQSQHPGTVVREEYRPTC